MTERAKREESRKWKTVQSAMSRLNCKTQIQESSYNCSLSLQIEPGDSELEFSGGTKASILDAFREFIESLGIDAAFDNYVSQRIAELHPFVIAEAEAEVAALRGESQ